MITWTFTGRRAYERELVFGRRKLVPPRLVHGHLPVGNFASQDFAQLLRFCGDCGDLLVFC